MTGLRVLVTGSRDWSDPDAIRNALNVLLDGCTGTLTVVHGDCRGGADTAAHLWAQRQISAGRAVAEEPHPADWYRYGRSAGPRRNAHMVSLGADVVLAFVHNHSSGTTGCMALAVAAGIAVQDSYLCTHQGPCPTPTPAVTGGTR